MEREEKIASKLPSRANLSRLYTRISLPRHTGQRPSSTVPPGSDGETLPFFRWGY